MNFATSTFFVFLAIVLVVYHRLNGRERKFRFLLAASWLFYMSWNPWFIWVILFTSVIDYIAGVLIEDAATPEARRRWLWLSVVSNLGFLAFFKYTQFVVGNGLALAEAMGWPVGSWTVNIVLPLGISFHTFQGISYTLDVYHGKIKAVRSFTDFALFVAFFPQLVAGPIVRAVEFLPQMKTPPGVGHDRIVEGLHWIIIGVFKKKIIADWLALYVDPVFAHPENYDAVTHRWAVLAYAAQIYCDFSGYSDIAIGVAKWFGFELPLNFRFPYLAGNIADFWRRWHISLSTWMRDYVYISFGGSRGSSVRTYANLIATMTLCGLWHGASWNYVLWGFYNGVLLACHRLYDHMLAGRAWAERLRGHGVFKMAAVFGTFLLVAAGLVLVRSQTWDGCWMVQQSLFGMNTAGVVRWVPAQVPLLVGLVVAGHLFSGLRDLRCGILELPSLVRAGVYVTALVTIIVFNPGVTKAFIYFQF